MQRFFRHASLGCNFGFLASRFGMPSAVVQLLRTFYSQVTRIVAVGVHASTPFRSTNSVLQGCALSLILAGMPVAVWTNAISHHYPRARIFSFVDDLGLQVEGEQLVADIVGAFRLTVHVDTALGVKEN